MLTQKIGPASDTLGIFLPLLSDLTQRRLEAKGQLKKTPKGARDHAYWDGLQNSFKSIINSFYGYIGGPFYFNDYDAARRVTEAGQTIVKQIAAELEAQGAHVIEIDTDGVYFQPPGDGQDRSRRTGLCGEESANPCPPASVWPMTAPMPPCSR